METRFRDHTPGLLLIMLLTATWLLAGVPAVAVNPSGGGGGAGYYQIDSDPEGADVLLDGRFAGDTPVTLTIFPTTPPGHMVTLSLAGYQPWSRRYPDDPGPGEVVPIYAVLQPTQSSGTLVVHSSPDGALVTLDGGHAQSAPWTYTNLVPGEHRVQAVISGYQPFTAVVSLPPGGTVQVNAVLPPLTNVGVLEAISTPGGADVYVDQFYSGITQTTVGNLQQGEHRVTLRLAGYQDWTSRVSIKGGATTTITPALTPVGRGPTGDLQVSSSPPGGAVYLDGVFQGLTPANEDLELTGITQGSHTISIQRRNYQDYQETVSVNPGQVIRIAATLTPSPSGSQAGDLQVTSQPSGAEVLINSSYRGITPLTLPSFPTGNYLLRIHLNGYQDYEQPVTVLAGQDQLISATLSPVPVTAPTKAGPFPGMIAVSVVLVMMVLRRMQY